MNLASLSFSTEQIDAPDRLESWHEIFSRSLLGVDLKSLAEDRIHTRAIFHQFAGVRVAFCSTSSLELTRTRLRLADGNDDVGLYINLTGTTSIGHLGRETVLAPGDATTILNNELSSVLKSEGSWIGITVPRKSLPFGLDPALLAATRIPRDSPALKVIIAYLQSGLGGGATASPDMLQLFATHVSELMAVAMQPESGSKEFSRLHRLTAIKADIMEHLEHNDLSIADVAARHGISPRAIQMLFKKEDTTFTEFLLRARLERAHRLLRDPRRHQSSIASIAFASGFNDVSYFNRAFRRQFDLTPSEARASFSGEPRRG